jgi:hypothetical protein
MDEKRVSSLSRNRAGDRSERLAQALRANLRRRKVQARARSTAKQTREKSTKSGPSPD